MAYRRSYRTSRPGGARWMELSYAGKCCICERRLLVGTRAFWDPADRSVTCSALGCARESGLTTEKWIGSPVSGGYVEVLSERRIGAPKLRVPAFVDTPTIYRNTRGRCEDAPCCGCCD